MEFRHHHILFDGGIIEHKVLRSLIIPGDEYDHSEGIIQAWACYKDDPGFGSLFQVLEVLFHDSYFFGRGLFEKTIPKRVDEIDIFRHG
jgi:hypothetical protein